MEGHQKASIAAPASGREDCERPNSPASGPRLEPHHRRHNLGCHSPNRPTHVSRVRTVGRSHHLTPHAVGVGPRRRRLRAALATPVYFPPSMRTPHGRRANDVSRQSVDGECHVLLCTLRRLVRPADAVVPVNVANPVSGRERHRRHHQGQPRTGLRPNRRDSILSVVIIFLFRQAEWMAGRLPPPWPDRPTKDKSDDSREERVSSLSGG